MDVIFAVLLELERSTNTFGFKFKFKVNFQVDAAALCLFSPYFTSHHSTGERRGPISITCMEIKPIYCADECWQVALLLPFGDRVGAADTEVPDGGKVADRPRAEINHKHGPVSHPDGRICPSTHFTK